MVVTELTTEDKGKLDRLLEIVGMFAGLDKLMSISVLQAMLVLSRHEGEETQTMAQRLGNSSGSLAMSLNELGRGFGDRMGRPRYELVEVGPDRKRHLTPKGVEFRDRLLALIP